MQNPQDDAGEECGVFGEPSDSQTNSYCCWCWSNGERKIEKRMRWKSVVTHHESYDSRVLLLLSLLSPHSVQGRGR